jgi:hypothetical protein
METYSGLAAANDDQVLLTYKDLELAILNENGLCTMPIAPANTYKQYSLEQAQFNYRYTSDIDSGKVDPGDIPVVMRGAWFLFMLKIKSINERERVVMCRFMSRFNINILSSEDAKKFYDHWKYLRSLKPKKRYIYRGSNNPYDAYSLFHSNGYTSQSYTVHIRGEHRWVSKTQIKVIKSISRHISKLEKMFGNKGDGKWQRLIQQAI